MPNGEMLGCAVLHTTSPVYRLLTIRAHCVQAVGAEHAFSRRNSKNGREGDPLRAPHWRSVVWAQRRGKPRLPRTRTGGVGAASALRKHDLDEAMIELRCCWRAGRAGSAKPGSSCSRTNAEPPHISIHGGITLLMHVSHG
jgi:hypothetical protein